MKLDLLLLAAAIVVCAVADDKPVIGVLTIPSNIPGYLPGNYSFIPASYIKHIESAGARVVPIPYDASPENITFILNQVNGVLFIGGAPKLTEIDPNTGEIKATNLTVAATYIFDHVLEANVLGEYIPITGTCLGMQVLAIAISQDLNILWTNFSNINHPSNIEFLPDTAQSSLWSSIPKELQDYAQKNNALYSNHNDGVAPSVFQGNSRLNALMKITTIGTPLKGGPDFVASAEGRQYPIYINQYHPEKAAFEWKKSVNAPHNAESIELAQHMINHFVNDARKNNRKFVSDKVLENSLIYNWVPLRKSNSFEQVYLFKTVVQDPKSWPGLFNTTN